jgi:hypothetical protein
VHVDFTPEQKRPRADARTGAVREGDEYTINGDLRAAATQNEDTK